MRSSAAALRAARRLAPGGTRCGTRGESDEPSAVRMSERGVVLGGTGGVWRVRTDGGEIRSASLRGRLKKVDAGKRADGGRRRNTVQGAAETIKLAVGDEVELEAEREGEAWAIAEILPRRSVLARREPG